jgi:hypothetical protein
VNSNHGSWVLARSQHLPEPEELEGRARQALAEAERDGSIPDRPVGTVATGSIEISVDSRGRVDGIEVSRRWKDQLDAGRFAAALFEAYGDAIRRNLEARARRDLLGLDDPPSAPAPEREAPDTEGLQPRSDTWFNAVMDEIRQSSERLEANERMARDGYAPDAETELTSPNEIFTMRLRGNALIGITGDQMQIRRADGESLRLEALDLFRAAHLTSSEGGTR